MVEIGDKFSKRDIVLQVVDQLVMAEQDILMVMIYDKDIASKVQPFVIENSNLYPCQQISQFVVSHSFNPRIKLDTENRKWRYTERKK